MPTKLRRRELFFLFFVVVVVMVALLRRPSYKEGGERPFRTAIWPRLEAPRRRSLAFSSSFLRLRLRLRRPLNSDAFGRGRRRRYCRSCNDGAGNFEQGQAHSMIGSKTKGNKMTHLHEVDFLPPFCLKWSDPQGISLSSRGLPFSPPTPFPEWVSPFPLPPRRFWKTPPSRARRSPGGRQTPARPPRGAGREG